MFSQKDKKETWNYITGLSGSWCSTLKRYQTQGGYGGRGHGGRGTWEWGGDKGQGHLSQAACTALPLGACPEGTSHKQQTRRRIFQFQHGVPSLLVHCKRDTHFCTPQLQSEHKYFLFSQIREQAHCAILIADAEQLCWEDFVSPISHLAALILLVF